MGICDGAKHKFKSDAFQAIHSSASAMYKVGAIDKATMRSFDGSCLTTPTPLEPQQIKKLRRLRSWKLERSSRVVWPLKLLSVVKKHGLEALA